MNKKKRSFGSRNFCQSKSHFQLNFIMNESIRGFACKIASKIIEFCLFIIDIFFFINNLLNNPLPRKLVECGLVYNIRRRWIKLTCISIRLNVLRKKKRNIWKLKNYGEKSFRFFLNACLIEIWQFSIPSGSYIHYLNIY